MASKNGKRSELVFSYGSGEIGRVEMEDPADSYRQDVEADMVTAVFQQDPVSDSTGPFYKVSYQGSWTWLFLVQDADLPIRAQQNLKDLGFTHAKKRDGLYAQKVVSRHRIAEAFGLEKQPEYSPADDLRYVLRYDRDWTWVRFLADEPSKALMDLMKAAGAQYSYKKHAAFWFETHVSQEHIEKLLEQLRK